MDSRQLEEWAEREVRRTPGARIILRTRTVEPAAFESAARRVRRGASFGVACRWDDPRGWTLLVRGADTHAWSHGGWMVPGGGAEPGEDPWEAVRREMEEEAGAAPRSLRLWKAYREEVRDPSGRHLQWWFFQFVARGASPSSLRTRVPEEIAEVRWFRRLPRALHFREDWLRPPRGPTGRPRLSRKAGASSAGRARAPAPSSR